MQAASAAEACHFTCFASLGALLTAQS